MCMHMVVPRPVHHCQVSPCCDRPAGIHLWAILPSPLQQDWVHVLCCKHAALLAPNGKMALLASLQLLFTSRVNLHSKHICDHSSTARWPLPLSAAQVFMLQGQWTMWLTGSPPDQPCHLPTATSLLSRRRHCREFSCNLLARLPPLWAALIQHVNLPLSSAPGVHLGLDETPNTIM